MKVENKKADMASFFVITILLVASFFIIWNYSVSNTNVIVTESEDLLCRKLTMAKDNTGVNIASEFIDILNKNCRKDNIESNANTQDEVFKETAESMKRCWYKYGEGQADFLSRLNSNGNWCFTCGKLIFEKTDDVYSYSNEFIPWLESNKFDGKDGSMVSYAEYMNLKYVDVDADHMIEIRDAINDLTAQDEAEMRPFLYYLSEQNQNLLDLRKKQINTNEDIYVVYRYDRLDKKTTELLVDVGGGILAGIATELVVEGAMTLGVGAALKIVALPGTLILKGEKLAEFQKKMNKIVDMIGRAVKYTKTKKVVSGAEDITSIVVSSSDDIRKISNDIAKVQPLIADDMLSIANVIDSKSLRYIDDLADANFDTIDEGKRMVEMSKDLVENTKRVNGADANRFNVIDGEYEVISRKFSAIDDVAALNNNKEFKINIADFIKNSLRISAAVAGGYIGYTYNDNSRQYVDILTKEQYYRLCGSEPRGMDKPSSIFND